METGFSNKKSVSRSAVMGFFFYYYYQHSDGM